VLIGVYIIVLFIQKHIILHWKPLNNITPLSLSKHCLHSHITIAQGLLDAGGPAHNLIPYTPIATSTSAPNIPPTARHSLLPQQNTRISPLKNSSLAHTVVTVT